MIEFATDLSNTRVETIGAERTKLARVSDFFKQPETVTEVAKQQSYARINPHYPGVRAEVAPELLQRLCQAVASLAETELGQAKTVWQGQAWYSIVTQSPAQLTPIQRLPHFDGFDETQLAVMIYLNHTGHGGTAFYRQCATGFERVTEDRYPTYSQVLQREVSARGLPPARYITDGAPHFEKIAESDAAFNSLILYPGTSLHSGVIRNELPLPASAETGRLTINGFFRPA